MKINLVTELVCKPHRNKHSGHMKINLVTEPMCKPHRNTHSGHIKINLVTEAKFILAQATVFIWHEVPAYPAHCVYLM